MFSANVLRSKSTLLPPRTAHPDTPTLFLLMFSGHLCCDRYSHWRDLLIPILPKRLLQAILCRQTCSGYHSDYPRSANESLYLRVSNTQTTGAMRIPSSLIPMVDCLITVRIVTRPDLNTLEPVTTF
jgi:hypothetical protein